MSENTTYSHCPKCGESYFSVLVCACTRNRETTPNMQMKDLEAKIEALLAQIEAQTKEIERLQAKVDFLNDFACPDCFPNGDTTKGFSPCVRHKGCEHGFSPEICEAMGSEFVGWDDTWEHQRKRAEYAEAERDALRIRVAELEAKVEWLQEAVKTYDVALEGARAEIERLRKERAERDTLRRDLKEKTATLERLLDWRDAEFAKNPMDPMWDRFDHKYEKKNTQRKTHKRTKSASKLFWKMVLVNNQSGGSMPLFRISKTKLRKVMKKYGFSTIKCFSEATGVSRGSLSEILSGKKENVTSATIYKIMDATDCSIFDLYS